MWLWTFVIARGSPISDGYADDAKEPIGFSVVGALNAIGLVMILVLADAEWT